MPAHECECTQQYINRETYDPTSILHTQAQFTTRSVVFVSSTLLLPVCFFNLSVYISASKPVRGTPTRAISTREKQIKCLMKANPGS